MTAPYVPGDRAAWVDIYATDIESAELVIQDIATVQSVTPMQNGRWEVETDKGIAQVRDNGIGAQLIPLDPEIEADIDQMGLPLVLEESLTDRDHELDAVLDQELIEQSLDGDGRDR